MKLPEPGWKLTALREIRRIRSSRQALMLAMVLPLSSALLIALIFGSSVPRALPVGVVDLDHSSISRQAQRMVGSAPGLRVAFQDTEPEEGFRRLSRGDVYALLVFPQHLSADVIRGRSPAIGVYVNGQMLLPASLVTRDIRQALGTLAAGVKIQLRRKYGETKRQAMSRYDPVRVEGHPLFIPELDYRRFLAPAIVAALLQIFAMFAGIRALGVEIKRKSAIRWFRHANERTGAALFGKLLPYAVIHTLVSLVLLGVWHGPMGNPVAGSFLAEWAALSMMGWAALAIAVFIVGWSADYRLALSMGAFFGGPSLAFAGVTFPTAAMNGPALGWSSMLPLSHAIKVVMDQSVKGAALRADWFPFAALVLLAVFFVGTSYVRWGQVLRDPEEWGQS